MTLANRELARKGNGDSRALIKASLPSIPIIGQHILIGLQCAVYEHFSICLNGKLKRGRLLFWPELVYTRP